MLRIPKDKKFLAGARAIDLCSGLGGFRLAFESFGGECVFASDFDESVADVYEQNFGDRPAGDITKIAEEDIPEHDILCAGFPCQPFSISGKQAGFSDTRGTIFFDIARIAKHHKPKLVFLENVKNFASHDKKRTLKTVIHVLNDLGYSVHHKVINASNFGVPQARERIYILAFREDIDASEYRFPKIRPAPCVVKDILEPAEKVADCIVDVVPSFVDNLAEIETKKYIKPIRVGHINLGRQGERIYHVNGHAITLSAHGGGIGAKTGLYYVDGVVRRLSPRECARLNGFPNRFKLHRRPTRAYVQLGNSVVVDVLQYLFFSLRGFI